MELITWVIPVAGIAAVAFALYLARDVLSRDKGTAGDGGRRRHDPRGRRRLRQRQYTTIGLLALVGAVVIGVVIGVVETPDVADVPDLAGAPIGIMTAIAFLVGAACSMASGIIGMFVSVRSNVRTAAAARTQPGRGGPGRDARRRRVRLPGGRPLAARRVGHLHRLPDASSAT